MPTGRFGGTPRFLDHPAQYVVAGYVLLILAGGALLAVPFATESGQSTSLLTALFTSTSAVCITGLTVVDTGTHWSGFGEAVILGLVQVGGLGIMTLSSLIVLGLARRMGLRHRLIAAASTGIEPGQVRTVLADVVRVTLAIEAVVAVALSLRFWITHGEPAGRALYLGVFHSVSAFNNAGFALFRDSLTEYAGDTLLLGVIAVAVLIGGLGFPVWRQIGLHPRRPRAWDLHAKLTVATTLTLVVVGAVAVIAFEWGNPATLGRFGWWDTIVNGTFHSVMPRSGGFNAIDIGALDEPTRLITEVLMFIGGGSASTAGGIKVTTFAVLGFVIWAELRGDPDVTVFRRRIPDVAQRQALTVALLAVGVVVLASVALLQLSDLDPSALRFETISALGTVGLSTGITTALTDASQVLLMFLMLLGRVGPPTLFAALVLREGDRLYRYPEERPLIG
ncbi:MAG: TrkH family potassium uptake protein [Actinomycetota bacterium]|nr:TrkH family potassium uptake protein [Actinomycetota bacterium]